MLLGLDMDYNVFNDCPSSMLVSLIDFGERSTSAHNSHLRSCVLGTVADLIGNKCRCRAQTSIRVSYLQHPCDVTCLVYTALLNIARFRAKRLASVRCACSSGHRLAVSTTVRLFLHCPGFDIKKINLQVPNGIQHRRLKHRHH